jgi:hypothetical protein
VSTEAVPADTIVPVEITSAGTAVSDDEVSVDTRSVDAGMLQRQQSELTAEAEQPVAGSHPSEHDPSEHQRPGHLPCLALCGEFSAGKSSIVNLLLGCDMLPTSVLSCTRRPTRLRYAPSLQIEAISDGGAREPVSPEAIAMLSREDIDHFDVGMPADLLRHVELLDTPGFADPFHDHQRTLDALESADVCVWCTLATQAWRESERQTWLNLPSRFRGGGILVVTHVDTLADRREQMRVRTRLEREAGDLFGDIVLLSVPDAVRAAQADNRTADPGLWRDSGGNAFVAALEKAVARRHAAHGRSTGDAAATLQTEPGSGFGAVFGFRPAAVESAAAAAEPPADAAVPAPANAAAEPADDKPAPAPASESERFLTRVMETVPACLAAAWIDLAGRELLLLREHAPGDIANSEVAINGVLGKAITDLFHGANVEKIESAFRHSRGRPEAERHYFQEIFILTDDCVGIFIRSSSRTDRALAIITDKTVNLGMVLSRARSLVAATDPLP